ncbi:MAG: phage protease, partial [Verrucomicrobiales bacterium]
MGRTRALSPLCKACKATAEHSNFHDESLETGIFALAAANSENFVPNKQTEHFSATSAANAIPVEIVNPADGWMRLSRYGRHPHAGVRKVQIFEKAQAETLVAAFHSTLTRLKQRLLGSANSVFERKLRLPIYEGHPDAPGFAGEPGHDDPTPYGHVEDLQAREDGLYAKIEWTAAGNALRAAGRKLYFSPYWTLFSRKEDPVHAYPMRLLSVGMHERVNISGSAANAATPPQNRNHQTNTTMLKKLLIALGFTEAQAEAAANGAEGAPSE